MTIFVVDHDADHLAALLDLEKVGGHAAIGFSNACAAPEAADLTPPHAILTDLRVPDLEGMRLLAAITATARDIPVILLTGQGDVTAAETILLRKPRTCPCHPAHDIAALAP
jgi:FixJ family two-component response regulator